ncbi:MAG TPA: 1-acyl-sn-glycerol-3-phosphate acyltransferase [Terriglobia bacterium]|nr:1-acyl-sn-glycerol-3-phosphate acyltransferase [Terriglobia bacterium]
MSAEHVNVSPPPSTAYRLARGLLRLWFRVYFPKIRLLQIETLPAAGPAVLVVNHPASLLDALILIAAFEPQIDCLVRSDRLRGRLRGFIARAFGMIVYDEDQANWQPALEVCREILAVEGVVTVFAEPEARKPAEPPAFAVRAATLALEAELRQADLGVALFPVHLYLPVAPSLATEVLIYVDEALAAAQYLRADSGQIPQRARLLAEALDRACRQNAFRLPPKEFARLLGDVEEVLRADLEAEWAARPNWKQSAEGFRLSRFVEESAEQLNALHPGRLIALRESLDRYHETERRSALRQTEIELSGAWVKSPVGRLAGWTESLVGFPVAVYGFVNHIPIALILLATGLLRRNDRRSSTSVWATRGLVVLACYAIGVAWCGRHFGRAAAGYYAASLPLSGAYLRRYAWLLQHRTRLLLSSARTRLDTRTLARLRKDFITELNQVRDTYSEFPGVAPTAV